ncbi:SpoIIE family protein phosphatase [Streptomyces tsukubensis]|uniref:SpoIIE family protein phosphatase n=1 Tax=Streptomyces tsukubensis TaxID=83656 RepID=UPI001D04403F|nr:SpoIIE family protein phosphatase [Streptomyces tsukubensis]
MSEIPAKATASDESPGEIVWQKSPPGSIYDYIRVASFSIGPDGLVEQWSGRAERLFGVRADEVVGRDPIEAFVPPELRERGHRKVAEILDGKEWTGVVPFRMKELATDGGPGGVARGKKDGIAEIYVMPTENEDGEKAAVCIVVDVRVLRAIETDLAASQAIFGQSPFGFLLFGTDLRVQRVNRRFAAVFGGEADSHRGKAAHDYLPRREADRLAGALRHVLESGESVNDMSIVGSAPGESDRRHWSVDLYRVHSGSGRPVGVAALATDVTRRHAAAREAAHARRNLALLNEAGARIGNSLDLETTARELLDVTVPGFCDLASVDLYQGLLDGDESPPGIADGSGELRRVAFASAVSDAPFLTGRTPRSARAGGTGTVSGGEAGSGGPETTGQDLGPDGGPSGGQDAGPTGVSGQHAGPGGSGQDAGPGGSGQDAGPAGREAGAGGRAAGSVPAPGGSARGRDAPSSPAGTGDSTPRVPNGRSAVEDWSASNEGPFTVDSGAGEDGDTGTDAPARDSSAHPGSTQYGGSAHGHGNSAQGGSSADAAHADAAHGDAAHADAGRRDAGAGEARRSATADATASAAGTTPGRLPVRGRAGPSDTTAPGSFRPAAPGASRPVAPPYRDRAAARAGAGLPGGGPEAERDDGAPVSVGAVHRYAFDSPRADALRTARPRLLPGNEGELVQSTLAVPMVAHDTVVGLAQFARTKGSEPFGERDRALAVELASRAAVCIDNARLYRREHERALILQRSLLPPGDPEASGLDIACRYLPGNAATEVGGDWFDVIELPGHRTALVVGDVMGRGLRAAVAMGELRTAVRTLALLDLEPAEVLSHLDEIARGLGNPSGTQQATRAALKDHDADLAEVYLATCVYAVYDSVTRRCTFANAGHLPPVLVEPGETALMLDVPPGMPLGVGGEPFEEVEVELPEGALLGLYTDGLVESRYQPLDEGLTAFRATLTDPGLPLEDICDHVLNTLDTHHGEDDIALLMARVQGLPEDSVGDWTLPREPRSVGKAREYTRAQLESWDLEQLADTTELLVSELVTNALRYGEGEIRLRLLLDRTLVCEVWDAGLVQPRRRRARATDEGGRGLQLVGLLSASWGSRRTPRGKTVWFEQALPDGDTKAIDPAEALLSLF